MKNKQIQYLLVIVLCSPLPIYLAWKYFSEKSSAQATEQVSDMLSVIHSRKSVRHFVPEKEVSKDMLEQLMRAGMAAPTAVNKQPWAFVAITERTLLDTLESLLPYASMLKQAPAAIVVCGDLTKTLEGAGQQFWIQDCSAATQNILLAAEALGLGAVWTAVYPDPERGKGVSQLLSMPETSLPLCVIPIGYPTGEDQPKDKFKAENIHWQRW